MQNTSKKQGQIIAPSYRKPPKTHTQHYRGPRLLTIVFSIVALIAFIHFTVVLHNAQSASPITCSGLIRTTDYTKYVQLNKNQQMGAVQFIGQVTGNTPSVLVQVLGTDAQHQLDVYVYGCILHQHEPTLTLLFKQQGLIQGTASISRANTLLISTLDTSLSSQAQAVIEPNQQNIYQEYTWQNDTFEQILFPGLYPVSSRGEAEALQEAANNGQSFPWNNPLVTAQQMAKDLFQWPDTNVQATIQDNDGRIAHVLLLRQQPSMQVTVTLSRLVQPDAAGLWFVTAAQTTGITVDQSYFSPAATSPMTIQGTVTLTNGTVTPMLFDHTLTPVQTLTTATFNIHTNGFYAGTLSFTNNGPKQTGLLLIENMPLNGTSGQGQLLLLHELLA